MTARGGGAPDGVVRVGAYALVVDDGRLHGPCPAADSSAGKSRPVALRELAEETGLIGEIETLASVSSHFVERSVPFEGRPLHAIFIIYRVRIAGGALRPEVGRSTDACASFGADEVAALPLMVLGRTGVALAFPAPSEAR